MIQVIAGQTIPLPYVGMEPDGTPASSATIHIKRMSDGKFWDGDSWEVADPDLAMTAGEVSANFWYSYSVASGEADGTMVQIECEATDCVPIAYTLRVQGGALAAAGGEMDLVDAPNATAVAALQDGLSTLTADENATAFLAATVDMPGDTDKTVSEVLQAAWAQSAGKWAISGTTLTLYAPDGTTSVAAFTLDSATAPTTRTPV